jgi:hypothetical protein
MFDVAKELCDALISCQVTDEASEDYGAIFCPAHEEAHPRTGEAVFPFCYVYAETKNERYLAAAVRLMKWLGKAQRDDGSWEMDDVDVHKLGVVSLTMALCHAHQVAAGRLHGDDLARLSRIVRRGAEYVYESAGGKCAEDHGPGVNCLTLSCPALQLAHSITGEQKYAERAKENALSVISRINEDGFLVGERVIEPCRHPYVDVGFDLEIGLPALTVYSCLTGNQEVQDAVLKALNTHLNFVAPTGYIDNSWGMRMYKWNVLGNDDGSGCQTAFLPLRNFDARFQRAAGQNLRFMVKNMMKDGFVTDGPHVKDRPECRSPCPKESVLRANGICQALIYSSGVPLARGGRGLLPTEEKGWVRFYRTVNVLQVRTSALLCTISGYGAGEPGGGTITHLWNDRFGTVQAASPFLFGCHDVDNPELNEWLTPRLELKPEDLPHFSNVFEPDAVLSVSGEQVVEDKFEVVAKGRMKSDMGRDPGLTYTMVYRFEGGKVMKEITADGVPNARLRSVEPIVFEKGCDVLPMDNGVEIKHPRGSSSILRVEGETTRIRELRRTDVIWSHGPALYAVPIVLEPAQAGPPWKMRYTIELHEWE